ncbi:metallophosphoesterase [Aeoliella mucimassa]|uniref:Cyclic 3',5'-adenosine monophosphate phosphodiesterase n=1 Tax=Aeoliella mucimassa TaxID=2527972 RepID=A0A518AJM5_9BACT|nr:metallophosphoesterase [Aeoliella mucimassa]QDU54931.1 cyclic 3',5'-adenosine monophosphate phosphodiesterase [Aeoliella mucimassa]
MPRSLLLSSLLALGCLLGSTTVVMAHEGHDHEHEAEANETSTSAVALPTGVVLPEIEGPRPWSDKPVLNDPQRFQIAIMTDRTGGHRPGIWMDAVRKLNMMRPEFVLSVGDLIEGYTEDRDEVEKQWTEFLGFIDQMDMRFFFVAGNHDVTNPTMQKIWREHFGRSWYSFDYKNVHFVCLCSEDPVNRIGDEQLEWLQNDLNEHADARWTLVFLHKPLWTYAERQLAADNQDKTNWKRVEGMLVDRPHTVFSGHIHHYVQYKRNNQEYFALATTGGGSALRGNEYGEFDQVTWLTMEPDGPHVANLRLDGILRPDVVTEESIARFNGFLANTGVEVAPILIEGNESDAFSTGEIVLRVRNDFDEPIVMKGKIEGLPLKGLTVDPWEMEIEAAAGESVEQHIHVEFTKAIEFEALARTVLTATLKSTGDDPLSSELVVPVVIDRRFTLPELAEMPELDGVIEEWPSERTNEMADKPLVLGNQTGWKGPGDATAKFFARQVGDRVYVAAKVVDDRLQPGDEVELLIDPRGVDVRSSDPRYARTGLSITATAPVDGEETKVKAVRLRNGRTYPGTQAAAKVTDDGYDVEFSIPLRLVKEVQGKNWHSLQGTLVLHDVDEPNEKAAEVVWRGTQRVRQVNTGFGHFVPEAN